MEQNQEKRRHFHRGGRRGPDRRGPDRRTPPPPGQDTQPRDGVDVEQIMRDIRARISQRHGIELSNQQIQELAARRLEAILDPRAIKPALLDELKRGAAAPMQPPPATPEAPYVFEDATLYESHNGFVRFMRALLKPLLRLLFNPAPIARALGIQSKLNVEAAQREAVRAQQQAEWNALHYELLQRMVTEISRVSIEMQALTMKAESLSAKVDFNERRVRGIEGVVHQPRASGRSVEPQAAASAAAVAMPEPAAVPEVASDGAPPPSTPGQPGDGTRRRRRRRRGRRGGAATDLAPSPGGSADAAAETEADQAFDDDGDEDAPAVAEALAATASSDAIDPASAAPAEQPEPPREPAVTPEPAAGEPVLASESAPEPPERE